MTKMWRWQMEETNQKSEEEPASVADSLTRLIIVATAAMAVFLVNELIRLVAWFL